MTEKQTLIATWMLELDAALAHGTARSCRDATQAVLNKLIALRKADDIEFDALNGSINDAMEKCQQLHDAFHQELQHELEWAGQHRLNID